MKRMKLLLESAWLKVDRANQHVELLREELEQFSRAQCKYVRVHRESFNVVYRLEGPPEEPPAHLSPIIGEALFGYRSALDHLMWELVEVSDGEPDRYTQFPIFDTPDDFHRGKRMQRGLSPEIAAAIEREQPFPPPGPPMPWGELPSSTRAQVMGGMDLAHLRDLHNIDKHRTFNLVTGIYEDVVPRHLRQAGGIQGWREFLAEIESASKGKLVAGDILARVPRRYANVEFEFSFSVAFDEGWIPKSELVQRGRRSRPSQVNDDTGYPTPSELDGGQSVLQTLGGIGGRVSDILEDYAERFVAPFHEDLGTRFRLHERCDPAIFFL